MQKGMLIVYEFGHAPGRAPLKALGEVIDVRAAGTSNEIALIKPVFWTVGSPLEKWVYPGALKFVSLNTEAEVSPEIEKASA